jgi:hypothetical protein
MRITRDFQGSPATSLHVSRGEVARGVQRLKIALDLLMNSYQQIDDLKFERIVSLDFIGFYKVLLCHSSKVRRHLQRRLRGCQ